MCLTLIEEASPLPSSSSSDIVAVLCIFLHRPAGHHLTHAGNGAEHPASLGHHHLDAGFINTLGVVNNQVLHRLDFIARLAALVPRPRGDPEDPESPEGKR